MVPRRLGAFELTRFVCAPRPVERAVEQEEGLFDVDEKPIARDERRELGSPVSDDQGEYETRRVDRERTL